MPYVAFGNHLPAPIHTGQGTEASEVPTVTDFLYELVDDLIRQVNHDGSKSLRECVDLMVERVNRQESSAYEVTA